MVRPRNARQRRFDECQGNFFAAGLTYYTIFALFPLLMVGFSVAGFLLSRRPAVLSCDRQQGQVRGARCPGSADTRSDELGDRRADVGRCHRLDRRGMGRPELDGQSSRRADRIVAAASRVRTDTSAPSSPTWWRWCRHSWPFSPRSRSVRSPARDRWPGCWSWLGLHDLPVLDGILRAVSVLVSFLLSWLVFGWMIARLPRDPVNFASSMRAGAARGDRLRIVQVGCGDLSEDRCCTAPLVRPSAPCWA